MKLIICYILLCIANSRKFYMALTLFNFVNCGTK